MTPPQPQSIASKDAPPLGSKGAAHAPKSEATALAVGGVAAILASACCLGPLVLAALGLGGAWVSNLTALEPYRPYFIVAALGAWAFAVWRINRPRASCKPGEVCAVPHTKHVYNGIAAGVGVLLLVALLFPHVAPMFY